MQEQQKKFMQKAIELASQNIESGNGGPFGAVIVKDGKIIAEGYNKVTSTNDPTAHAEIVAIREACKTLNSFQLENCEIYTSCEPCPMCLGAIYWARPSKVFFSCNKDDAADANFDDYFIYKELSLPMQKRSIPMIQLMRNEGLKVFEKWLNSDHKIAY